MTGIVLAQLALTVLVYVRTGSPLLAALVFATGFLPQLIAGTLFSALVDRVPARRLLVGCNVVSGALAAVMAIPATPVAVLLVLAFLLGLIRPVFLGARSATLKDVLPSGSFVPGRSLIRLVSQGAQIAGYGVGGLLLAIASPRGALAADAATFATSALLVRVGTTQRPPRAAKAGSMARDSLAGVRAVLAHRPTRRVLLFGWLIPACAVAPEALAAPYAVHIGQPARAAGFLLVGIPVGTVIADVLAARVFPARLQYRLIVPAGLLTFVPLAGFAVSPGLELALGLLVVSGLGSAWMPGMDGLLVATAPPALRSRALALSQAGLMFTQGAGFALWGIAGQYAPLPVVIPLAAAAGGVAVIAFRPPRRTGAAPLGSVWPEAN